MVVDVVQELGYLTLGTRFKRIGERLQAQTQNLLNAAGLDIPASQAPLLAALDRLGPMKVGEIAQALGTSQPGVTRTLDKLESIGLLLSSQTTGDRRVRTIELTEAGQRLVDHSKRIAWPAIEAAVADACADLTGPLLAQLTALEDALAAAPLGARRSRLRVRDLKHART